MNSLDFRNQSRVSLRPFPQLGPRCHQGPKISELILQTKFQPSKFKYETRVFWKCFSNTIRVPRIENLVPRIIENYHRAPRMCENCQRVPRNREIVSLRAHTGYLTFSLKKPWCNTRSQWSFCQSVSFSVL